MEKPLRLNCSYAGTLEAGMKWNVGIDADFYTGFYVDYGLNNPVKGRGKNHFVEYNYDNPTEPQINGLLTSLQKVSSLSAGIKLKLAFSVGCRDLLAEKRRYKNMQTDVYWNNSVYDYPPPAEFATQEASANDTVNKVVNDSFPSFRSEVLITNTIVEMKSMEEPETETTATEHDPVFPSVITIDGYKLGQVSITPEQKVMLEKCVDLLQENPQLCIEITGHACDTGTKEKNLRIGRQRADSAKDYLTEKGLSSSRISVHSKGDSEPVCPNSNEESREKNRRLEIKLNQ
jgi:outer membrane protein OmpA-like peptidoglycan-associated protein